MIFIKNIAVKIVSFVIGIYISNTTLKQTIKGTIAEDEYKRTQRYIVFGSLFFTIMFILALKLRGL